MPDARVVGAFQAVEQNLRIARDGARDVAGKDPSRRLPGLGNVVNFGGATTNALQKLRHVVPGFDAWWSIKEAEMKTDPLLRYFYELRIELFHKGKVAPLGGAVSLKELVFPRDLAKLGPKPAGAKSYFAGDNVGGAGWIVPGPDGDEKVYVDFPGDIGTVLSHMPEAPETHLGAPVGTRETGHLCSLYVRYLERLVAEAKRKFGS